MIYEIINPSDPYSIDTDDAEAAAMAIVILGNGAYGLKPLDGSDKRAAPMLLFSSNANAELDEWWMGRFGHAAEEFTKSPDARTRMAAVLETTLIGEAEGRKHMQDVFACVKNDDERRAAMEKYHDVRRGSMNDIGGRARRLAASLRKNPPLPASAKTAGGRG